MKKFYLNLAVAASAIALTACGGGGKSLRATRSLPQPKTIPKPTWKKMSTP